MYDEELKKKYCFTFILNNERNFNDTSFNYKIGLRREGETFFRAVQSDHVKSIKVMKCVRKQ